MNTLLDIHPDVITAQKTGMPVVALESTVFTHGLPSSVNLDVAKALHNQLLNMGVQPAQTAIIKGRMKVGVSSEELTFLCSGHPDIAKASRRDLAGLLSLKLSGGTTVATTMMLAAMAEIPIFATGGIGGVHRDGHETFDISADLHEFTKTAVAVVCSGPKIILDLPKTQEYLETMGIPTVGYKTEQLPAFYSSSSGLSVDYTVNTPEQAALFIDTQYKVCPDTGLVICQPVPNDVAIATEVIEPVIEEALFHAKKQQIHGKALTPFLIKNLYQQHGETLLKANIALLKNNTHLAGEIAEAYSKLA